MKEVLIHYSLNCYSLLFVVFFLTLSVTFPILFAAQNTCTGPEFIQLESVAMLDKINECSFLDDESHKTVSTVARKLENLQLANKKQKSVKSYFT